MDDSVAVLSLTGADIPQEHAEGTKELKGKLLLNEKRKKQSLVRRKFSQLEGLFRAFTVLPWARTSVLTLADVGC